MVWLGAKAPWWIGGAGPGVSAGKASLLERGLLHLFDHALHRFPETIEFRPDGTQLVAQSAVFELQDVLPGVWPVASATKFLELEAKTLVGDHQLPPLGEHLLNDAGALRRCR